MKVHEGNCSGQPCTRTHGYKCRLCQTWFKQAPLDIEQKVLASPWYPYCSKDCAMDAHILDPGYVLYAQNINVVHTSYPEAPSQHKSDNENFDTLLKETKEL